MSHEDIRERLAAVEGIDWSKVKREPGDREIYGDIVDVGPVMLFGADLDVPAERAEEEALVAFLQHATADLRRLLADLDHATTTREAVMPNQSNPVYGPPPDPERGQPATFLGDVVEVLRPNGAVVRMDLVALADAAINADRAVVGLREEIRTLSDRIGALENQATRTARAARIMAGETYEGELGDDLHDRVRDLEQRVDKRAEYEREMQARSDG